MGNSTLDLENDFNVDRKLGTGHGANALGPSNSSDSGSDVTGILDSDNDTDSTGTGERATVDMMDSRFDKQETGVDRIESIASDEENDDEEDDGSVADEISKRI
jgi:hypothetical protein